MVEAGKRYKVETKSKTPTGEIKTENFVTKIDWIEDRGEYLYVGHSPEDKKHGLFGAFRIYKNEEKPFGTKILGVA